ncbi:2-amino-4-hydroxy-6-hydroxymethyldihydropteridine diphosphokinase [Kibdelosporangium philippinense]|uniref:2-amino-4-hydroxy-6-hydroxymethyldihydropteridine diphosphokinase n=1 Tax=Kibdelosporangium philippinense TaxID=211113 RepID=A0ABS8ZQN5_9PSEU|nr:2-amino-4-hydroxy-6-hydroxymethyldihydropteridine diphosphokinase [Kibdelosporangium philippinense]MCE7009235.1 2-amino-4-hydroxy-6-hydroxymethyldihydropteridine diphosphokinase [Kibdelosporangium philippinense]
MTTAVLSIGSNMGDRLGHLQSAVDGLPALAVSSVYETAPWGVTDQDDFLNAIVVASREDFDEWDWLRLAQDLENAAGRVREVRWGPRSLDVDVITVIGVTSTDPRLELPHPRAHERAFVLVPWLELQPDASLPGHGPIADLVTALGDEGVRLREDLKLEAA